MCSCVNRSVAMSAMTSKILGRQPLWTSVVGRLSGGYSVERHCQVQHILQAGSGGQRPRPTSAEWKVREAPVSCSLKIQLGRGEIIYTMHGVTDEEGDDRLRQRLAFLQELEDEIDRRRASPAAPPEAAGDSGSMQEMIDDAIQRAMQAWTAAQTNGNGHAEASPPPEAPQGDTDRYNNRGDKWCKGHQVWLKQRQNEGGKWHSHWIAAENR